MKTLILAGLLAVTALSAAQPAAAIIIRPPQGCGMAALCKMPPAPAPVAPRPIRLGPPGGYTPPNLR